MLAREIREICDAMYRFTLFVGLALSVSGCGPQHEVSEKNATVEDVSNSVREATGDSGIIRPGKWVSTVSVEELSMPGVPPQAAAQMKDMIAQNHRSETCLSEEDARRPSGEFFGGSDQCRYEHFTMRRGKIDAKMTCATDKESQVMAMSGKYSSNSYQITMRSVSQPAGESEGMTMQMTVDAKRVGKCEGENSG